MKFYDRANTSTWMQKSWFFETVERKLESSRKTWYQKQIYRQIQKITDIVSSYNQYNFQ